MDFKIKYLKYKKKYLYLKKLIGSSDIAKLKKIKRIRSIPEDEIDNYKNYLKRFKKHSETFIKNFKAKKFEIDIKDSIYIRKSYNFQSQENLLKLSFHNYQNINNSNHIHLIKYLETTNEKYKKEYDILTNKKKNIGTSGRLLKKNKKIFKRSDNDYFYLSFNINNKNILLFNLKLFNEGNQHVENWNNNLKLFKNFINKINKCIEDSIFEIVIYNFYNNQNFRKKIKDNIKKLNFYKSEYLDKNSYKFLIHLNIIDIIDNFDDNDIIELEMEKNIFDLWKNLINEKIFTIDLDKVKYGNNNIPSNLNNEKIMNMLNKYKDELQIIISSNHYSGANKMKIKQAKKKRGIVNSELNNIKSRKNKKEIKINFRLKKLISEINKKNDEEFNFDENNNDLLEKAKNRYNKRIKIDYDKLKITLKDEIYKWKSELNKKSNYSPGLKKIIRNIVNNVSVDEFIEKKLSIKKNQEEIIIKNKIVGIDNLKKDNP
jgi:hypothetical protein